MSKAVLVYQNQPASGKFNHEQIIELALRKSLVRVCKNKTHMGSLNLTANLHDENVKVDDFSTLDILEIAEGVSRRYPYGMVFVDLGRSTYALMDGTYFSRTDKVRRHLTEMEKLNYENWFKLHFYDLL